MRIEEMRSALAATFPNRMGELPSSMPDWAVRHAYERRNGMRVTALPTHIEARRQSVAAPVTQTATDSEAERIRLRLSIAKML